ncbi:hypothetical protein EJV46_09390 [Roseococcus sp. SYP-B2431]|uniref:hypothetical protein n=1 Tax=Roseococcus sp. SYP-B2431 TaxID=2496640 RepID=UPI00103D7057|nr:hypothetical protein [Roseococcus sp. SYP-B2431]TCH98770.1 hypothetical protein EJV46_09390 [Roseococcus sp. SYP-B2431]
MSDGLSMLFATAMVTLASALAHQLWLEVDGGRLYSGEPAGHERSGALIERIAGPRIFALHPAAAQAPCAARTVAPPDCL